jgi:hypothetical protein
MEGIRTLLSLVYFPLVCCSTRAVEQPTEKNRDVCRITGVEKKTFCTMKEMDDIFDGQQQ